ncbi:hypothetical protein Zm00014a_039534 [Zea mays]|uniref:Uncharacterized protein n=1 Tax=Zea mays TaxID=4577 RepID=A0A3L6FCV3_MAIZE|nr:hypothetical protein Zm00014a_039534 [Zea mays]
MERYRCLPFPFEPVGVGAEGAPADVDMEVEMTLEDLVGFLNTGSVVTTAGQGEGRGPGGGLHGRAEAGGGRVGRRAHRTQEARVQGVHARREAPKC